MSLVHMVMSSLSEQIWKLNSLESLKNDVMKSAAVEHAFAAVDHNGLSACTTAFSHGALFVCVFHYQSG